MSDEPPYVLLTDQPWIDGNDPLGFDDLAGRLAGLVLASRDSTPLALGVLGGWGSGKSTLMRRLEQQLGVGRDVDTVWFNAWTAEGKSVLEGMIKSVLVEIGPKALRRAMRSRKLITGIRLVTTLGMGFFGVGRLVDEVWDRFSADANTRNELPKLLGDAMKDWRRRSNSADGRLLVVFVDDLDRCSPANVVEVFEAVKLYLDAPGFVFVVGYDDRMVASALDREKAFEDWRVTARYLEKIVQIEYRVPRPDDQQSRALVDALAERSRTAELLGDAERSLIADSSRRNPRRVKRFLNSFVLETGSTRRQPSSRRANSSCCAYCPCPSRVSTTCWSPPRTPMRSVNSSPTRGCTTGFREVGRRRRTRFAPYLLNIGSPWRTIRRSP